MKLGSIILLLIAVLLTSCENMFQYNPNQIVLKESEKGLTEKNIAKLKAPSDTLKFVFMGDTQRWYDESVEFVKSANQLDDISFVIHAGDISDFGLSQEFRWINEIMQGLKVPYLTIVGNHDLIANGNKTYQKMYGDLDYSFQVGNHKFIAVNTNSREYAFDGTTPNLTWLKGELARTPKGVNTLVMAHIPPFDSDFDPRMEEEFAQILANDPNVKLALFGHRHSDYNATHYDDGVEYFVSTSMGKRGYLVVSLWEGGHSIERKEF